MDYQQAKDTRGKSLSSLITDKIVSGGGIGSSIRQSISEKNKARMIGLKEKFDPLNLIKMFTGSQMLLPAILGRLLGRNSKDIGYFTNQPQKKSSFSGLQLDTEQVSSAVEVLGLIYRLMLRTEHEKQIALEEKNNYLEEDNLEEDRRTEELIKALTARKKPKAKRKKETEEKQKPVKKDNKKNNAVDNAPTNKRNPPSTATEIPKTKEGVSTATKVVVGTGLAASAASLLAKEEGFSSKAYWDPKNQRDKVSIGYGHQIKPEEYQQGFIQVGSEQIPLMGEKGIDTKITKEQALKLKEKDLEKYTNDTIKSIGEDAWAKLTDQQRVALISSTYNTGKGGMDYLVKNGLRDAILNDDPKKAANIIREYGFKREKGVPGISPALEKRRFREADMFESGANKQNKTDNLQNKNNSGQIIDSYSKENRDLKNDIEESNQQISLVNNTNINSPPKNIEPPSYDFDDRPAYLKKVS